MNQIPRPNRDLLRAEVQRLRDNGWQVVRLRQGTKMPLEKGWPNLVREAGDFQDGDNVGVRFGPESGGLVDVDLDYPAARALIGHPAFGLDHLAEFGRMSLPAGQRGHRLAIVPDGPDQSRVFALRSTKASALLKERGLGLTVVEIRGSHGSQTAVPPSIIAKKGAAPDRLVWTDPDAIIPEIGWDELNRRVGRLAVAALAAAVYPSDADHRDAFCIALFGALLESGVDLRDAARMTDEVSRVAGDEAYRDVAVDHAGEGLTEFLGLTGFEALSRYIRLWLGLSAEDRGESENGLTYDDAVDSTRTSARTSAAEIDAEMLKRILDQLDPCDFADYDSHREMLHAAHHATGGEKTAREVFISWCARNLDFGPGKRDEHGKPWREVVSAMWDRANTDRGEGAPMNTLGTLLHHLRQAGEGELASEIARKVEARRDFADEPIDPHYLEDVTTVLPAHGGDGAADAVDWEAWFRDNWTPIGRRDITKIPPTPWLVEGLLLYGDVTTIGGRGGSGKSLLAWQIVCAVAAGRSLAWWPAPERPRKVLVISGEDDVDEIERRVSAACQAMRIGRSDLGDNFMVWNQRTIRLAMKDAKSGKVTLTKLWHGIRWAVENFDVGLIVADPLIKGSSGFEESRNDHMDELYGLVRNLVVDYPCAALTVDHFAKGGTGGDQASIRGASAKVDAARVAITLTGMTEEEASRIKPPRPREAYALCVDAKQNYARKSGGHWLELIDFEVGNGEQRPSLVWRNLDSADDFLDPLHWKHRDEFLRLVAEGYAEDGKDPRPWSAASAGPRSVRLSVAVSQRFDLTEKQAGAWIKAFADEGSIRIEKWSSPSRTTSLVWALNPDYQTEEDEETEAMRE